MLSVAGCGSATPTSPTTTSSVVSPAGNWSGSISDAISGDGTMQLALSELSPPTPTGTSLTGTWSATFKNGDSFSGPAVGGLFLPNGYGITLYVQTPPPPCATGSGPGGSAPLGFTLINVVVTSSRLTAVTGRISCNGMSLGTVNLSKQ
jgi:hypothetical protein